VGRVSQETIDRLNAFIETLPVEARKKCALCNETLTHIVKHAEVETRAGTATVTRALADKINETAAPQDMITKEQLRGRVQRNDGTVDCTKHANNLIAPKEDTRKESESRTSRINQSAENPKAEEKPQLPAAPFSTAKQFSMMAISQLTRIRQEDPQRVAALMEVRDYIDNQLSKEDRQ